MFFQQVTWALCGGLGIGLPPVVNFGSDYLKEKVVKDCLAGTKNICLCVTEPSGGSDVAGLQTEAKDMGDHYILNGEKKVCSENMFLLRSMAEKEQKTYMSIIMHFNSGSQTVSTLTISLLLAVLVNLVSMASHSC